MATPAMDLPPGEAAGAGGPGPKKHEHEQTAGLEKVTDYVEEQDISPGELGQVRVKHKIRIYCAACTTQASA